MLEPHRDDVVVDDEACAVKNTQERCAIAPPRLRENRSLPVENHLYKTPVGSPKSDQIIIIIIVIIVPQERALAISYRSVKNAQSVAS